MEEKTSGEASGKIDGVPGVGAAKVFLGDDHILRVEIDLNVPEGFEVEGRVGAYGTLEWAREIASRYFMMQEMKKAQKVAVEQAKAKQFGILRPQTPEVKLPN